ncbi:MAG: phospho-sugar mutase [Planctomycetes bacterium]|nr:phospho-sugar mutase [Planctomycetota bacterium]
MGIEAVQKAVAAGQLTIEAGQNVQRWLSEPQYQKYQPPLLQLVSSGNFAELNRLFWERIPFGTGGRRGPMSEFGSATINERTIAESAHGLAVYVLRCRSDAPKAATRTGPRAVIAFDSRHRSLEFAKLTACVLAAHGFHVEFFPQARSTPELSFAVRHLHCDTGVMISASHNPPSDNGFKAYWSTGGQILPPHDAGIIACVDAATDIPTVNFDEALADGRIASIGKAVDEAYVSAVCQLGLSPDRDITALFTPLHGVGETSVFRVVQQAGFQGVSIYEPQRSQDGDFPNVPDHLPNPERFAVFGPAIAEATRMGVDLVLASDPDADRMAVAVCANTPVRRGSPPVRRGSPDPAVTQSGSSDPAELPEFVCLTGNQLGALLTDHVLRRRQAAGTISPDHYIIETLVTTPLIAAIGYEYGVQVIRDVLVGFKHIAGEIDARRADHFVFAAEESIGFMAGDYCRDKDAAVGALFVLELAAELKRQGKTLLDQLEDLYSRHGYYLEETVSTMCPGPTGQAQIRRIMAAFRKQPPAAVAGCVWASVRDYSQHEVRSLPSNRVVEQLPAPSGNLLIFNGQCRDCKVTVAMRPSGTEPKIKFYYFINTTVQPLIDEAKRRAAACLAEVQQGLQQWMDEVPAT